MTEELKEKQTYQFSMVLGAAGLLAFFFLLTSLLEYNCFTMVCQFPLYNKVNQLYIQIYPNISSLLSLPPTPASYPSRWTQSMELISLCYAAASHQLSISHLVVYICPCHSLTSPQLTLPPPCVLKSILYVCIFIPVLHLGSSEPFLFFDSICVLANSICFFLFLTYFTLYDRLQVHPPHYK